MVLVRTKDVEKFQANVLFRAFCLPRCPKIKQLFGISVAIQRTQNINTGRIVAFRN
jgi:hypothetical protein